ncbi:MAG: DUF1549 and DUF1553 domain-containing protein [Verrucomicrobiia bacterium]|jgi:hypothetical protein
MKRIGAILLLLHFAGPTPAADPSTHWAYQPIVIPAAGGSIDRLLDQKLSALDLKPQAVADRLQLLRRVYLDLVGLAPTRVEQRTFLENPSAGAYDSVVERLLATPQYGERWGRHWMDIWRYSDWYGLGKQLRNSQKHIWRWRDWIVNSLNSNKGYDRMILEMLAGDELAPADQKVIAGTGFLARNYYLFNRTSWLDNTIEHTAKAFLGMTLNCAKCHDHKYDPISHEEYYRFRAIFEPHQIRLDAVPGESDFEKDGLPRAFDDHPEAVTHLHLKGDAATPDKSRNIQAGVPALVKGPRFEVQPVNLPAFAYAPGTREHVRSRALARRQSDLKKAEERLANARVALDRTESGDQSEILRGKILVQDDFKEFRSDLWHAPGKDWKYEAGALIRHTSGREDDLRSKFRHPTDFEAVFRYRTTGGATYKSIGLSFDRLADADTRNQVYTSANAPGPKIQFTQKLNGKSSYPATGRVVRPIEVGHLYELRLMVRGELLNVYLDDQFQFAYRLTRHTENGLSGLTAFDATAEFHSFELRDLPGGIPMVAPGGKPALAKSPADIRSEIRLSEANLVNCSQQLASLKARIAADRARVKSVVGDKLRTALTNAAAAELKATVSANEYLRLQEELKLGRDKKDSAAKKNLQKFMQTIAAAQKKFGNPGTNYTSLAGSLKALETPAHKFGAYDEMYAPTSTGRRLALARWLTSRDNPLTARVAVNHIWLRHFGTPLVESVADFGMRAPEPKHLELLNWLAAEFMAHDWSMKHLHQLIVTSAAYRRDSSALDADVHTLKTDPDNAYYWRANPRRMESQLVRDNLLHLAGTLDRTVGGPAIKATAGGNRRSLYFRHGRDDVPKFLSMFDDADFLQCYQRSESVVPQQALALSNSEVSLTSAEKIAALIKTDDDVKLVSAAFETILNRQPDPEETAACVGFMKRMNGSDRHVRLVHALLNHNDFLVIR